MTRDSSQSHILKITKLQIDKLTSFSQKEMSFFCFSDDQYWRKFSSFTVSPSGFMTHFKYHVFHLIQSYS